jgi:nicotinamide-nucleotide amidase
MVSDEELYELAVRVGQKLRAAARHIVTAESCTGGWVSKALTDVPGRSRASVR